MKNYDPNKISKVIKYGTGYGSYITIQVDKDIESSFMMEDFRAMFPNMKAVEILDIYVRPTERNNGVGSNLIKTIVDEYNDHAILVGCGASMKEYPEEPSDSEKVDIAHKTAEFYKKNGFEDVNDQIADYEFKIAMLYTGNDIGRQVYEQLTKPKN